MLGAPVVLFEARYEFTDVLPDPGTRDADQCPLDVVPELPRLCLDGAMTVRGRVESKS
jgi:hypothetical protein